MIGESIKAARKRAGLTQEELGQKIGMSGVAIMRYEKGQREPSKETVEKIAKKLNVHPNNLMGWGQMDVQGIKEDIKFIDFLESIGYSLKDDTNPTKWEKVNEEQDGISVGHSEYPIEFDDSPDAPYCILVKDGVSLPFTNQQFKDFTAAIITSVEYHIFEHCKNLEKQKSPTDCNQ